MLGPAPGWSWRRHPLPGWQGRLRETGAHAQSRTAQHTPPPRPTRPCLPRPKYLVHGRQPRCRLPSAGAGVLPSRQLQLGRALCPWCCVLQGHACGPCVASWKRETKYEVPRGTPATQDSPPRIPAGLACLPPTPHAGAGGPWWMTLDSQGGEEISRTGPPGPGMHHTTSLSPVKHNCDSQSLVGTPAGGKPPQPAGPVRVRVPQPRHTGHQRGPEECRQPPRA